MAEVNPQPLRPEFSDSGIRAALAARDGNSIAWRLMLKQRELPLSREMLSIGSDPTAVLQIQHHSVRPSHAVLEKLGDRYVLKAMPGAAVRVNDRLIQNALLSGGERIRIGDIELRLERREVESAVLHRELSFYGELGLWRRVKRELDHAPWLLISIAFHAILFYVLYEPRLEFVQDDSEALIAVRPERGSSVEERGDSSSAASDMRVDSVPAEVVAPEVDSTEIPALPTTPTTEISSTPPGIENALPTIGLGAGAGRGVGMGSPRVRHGGGLSRGRGIGLDQMDRGLASKVAGFRDGGLDLVVLIDTTSSMDSLIESAKHTIDEIITNMAALVPDLRIGMVAYRDREQGEAYLTKISPLSDDRYKILNFLESLDAGGGGDTPEAIYDAIHVAFKELGWRQSAYHALLLVGDAPPHKEDLSRLYVELRNQIEKGKGRTFVSTICVAKSGGGYQQDEVDKAVKAFQEIARVGQGEFTHLTDVTGVGDELIASVVGNKHKAAIAAALKNSHHDVRDSIVEAKVRDRDLPWLIERFDTGRLDPLVIDALIRIRSNTVAMRCLSLVRADDAPRPQREAALYILRRTTDYRGTVDLDQPHSAQAVQFELLVNSIRRAYSQDGADDPVGPRNALIPKRRPH